jgi:transcriptional regulator GlxA family with amidase domain
MKQPTDPALIGVLIYDDVEPIDLGGTVGVVSMARRVLPNVAAAVIGRWAGPVRLAGGVTVQADHGIDAAPQCDVVIVCGGAGWPQAAADPALLAYLFGLTPGRVASVCTGAMILAAAGVLDGLAATTRRHAVGREAASPLDLLANRPSVRPVSACVVDAGVVTGGGVSLAIDTTLYLLGRIYGPAVLAEVTRVIEYDRAYAANRDALGHLLAGLPDGAVSSTALLSGQLS